MIDIYVEISRNFFGNSFMYIWKYEKKPYLCKENFGWQPFQDINAMEI